MTSTAGAATISSSRSCTRAGTLVSLDIETSSGSLQKCRSIEQPDSE